MKKILSLLMTAVMAFAFTAEPFDSVSAGTNAFAADVADVKAVADNLVSTDIEAEGTDSFGKMLAEEVAGQQEEKLSNTGFNITDVELESDIYSTDVCVRVEYTAVEDCTLVVGIYEEDDKTLVCTGNAEVYGDYSLARVEIPVLTMPEYFYIKAYLIDPYSLEPLCPVYEDETHTQEMQEFLNKTVEDYDADRVVNFDENISTNYAVYNEGVVVIPYEEGFNDIVYDENGGVYTVGNPSDDFAALQAGDIFAYTDDTTGDIYIAKVGAVDVNGDGVTVTEADVELEEVFEDIKIESEGTNSDFEIENYQNQSVITSGEPSKKTDAGVTDNTKLNANLEFSTDDLKDKDDNNNNNNNGDDDDKIWHGDFAVKFGVELNLSAEIEFYLHKMKFYVTADFPVTAKLSGSIEGKGGFEFPLGKAQYTPIPSLNLVLKPKFVIDFSGTVEVSVTAEETIGFKIENTKFKNNSGKTKITPSLDGEAELFIGFDLNPEINFISSEVFALSGTAKAGFDITASVSKSVDFSTVNEETTIIHDCKNCFDGDASIKLEFGIAVKGFKKTIVEVTKAFNFRLGDFYISLDSGNFGWGECPNNFYRVLIKVVNMDQEPIEGTVITSDRDVRVISDGQSLIPEEIKTDENGEAEVFMCPNNCNMTYSCDGYEYFRTKLRIKLNGTKDGLIINGDDDDSGSLTVKMIRDDRYYCEFWVKNKNGIVAPYANVVCESEGKHYKFKANKRGALGLQFTEGVFNFKVTAEGYQPYTFTLNVPDDINPEGREYIILKDSDYVETPEPTVSKKVKYIDTGDNTSLFITEDNELYLCGLLRDDFAAHNSDFYLSPDWDFETDFECYNYIACETRPVKIAENVKTADVAGNSIAYVTTSGDLYSNNYNIVSGAEYSSNNYGKPVKVMGGVKDVKINDRWAFVLTEDNVAYLLGESWYLLDSEDSNSIEKVKVMSNVKSIFLDEDLGVITNSDELYMYFGDYSPYLEILEGNKTYDVEDERSNRKLTYVASGVEQAYMYDHLIYLTTDGELYSYEYGYDYSETTDGEGKLYSTLKKLKDNVKSFTYGFESGTFACIDNSDNLYVWGYNYCGLLGNGKSGWYLTSDDPDFYYDSPVKLLSDIKQVYFNAHHAVCLTNSGEVYTWGGSFYGQLGNGSFDNSYTPGKIIVPDYSKISMKTSSPDVLADEANTGKLSYLKPNTVYNYYVLFSQDADNLIDPANLEYITQFVTDENGNASIDIGDTILDEGTVAIMKEYTGEVSPGKLGDVNNDKMVDASDASLVLAEYAMLSTGQESTLTEKQSTLADVTGDNMVDAGDASLILGYYAYLSTTPNPITDMLAWLNKSD